MTTEAERVRRAKLRNGLREPLDIERIKRRSRIEAFAERERHATVPVVAHVREGRVPVVAHERRKPFGKAEKNLAFQARQLKREADRFETMGKLEAGTLRRDVLDRAIIDDERLRRIQNVVIMHGTAARLREVRKQRLRELDELIEKRKRRRQP